VLADPELCLKIILITRLIFSSLMTSALCLVMLIHCYPVCIF
jgi:hypothetical protein